MQKVKPGASLRVNWSNIMDGKNSSVFNPYAQNAAATLRDRLPGEWELVGYDHRYGEQLKAMIRRGSEILTIIPSKQVVENNGSPERSHGVMHVNSKWEKIADPEDGHTAGKAVEKAIEVASDTQRTEQEPGEDQ